MRARRVALVVPLVVPLLWAAFAPAAPKAPASQKLPTPAELIERPSGRTPEATDQVYGGVPPLTVGAG